MLIAEELEVDLKNKAAPGACSSQREALCQPLARRAGNRQLHAIRGAWKPLPRPVRPPGDAGVGCRETVECRSGVLRAQRGEVLHPPTERSLTYGELPRCPPRAHAVPKTSCSARGGFQPSAPRPNPDTAARSTTAVYGIDVWPPGVKIATLTQSPVFGGRVKRVDDAATKVVKGVPSDRCGSTTLSRSSPTTWALQRKGSRPW